MNAVRNKYPNVAFRMAVNSAILAYYIFFLSKILSAASQHLTKTKARRQSLTGAFDFTT